jgi:hypothetical protein
VKERLRFAWVAVVFFLTLGLLLVIYYVRRLFHRE